jgi:excisionase family DNA binding protein
VTEEVEQFAHRHGGLRDVSRDMAVMKTVSIDRAAEILQVSRRTIYNHIRRGYLQTIRTIGGQSQRVTLESLALVQGSGRRRGERFFVAERNGDTARIPESIEAQHHGVQHPASMPASDAVNRLGENLGFLGRATRLRSAQDVVETTNHLRVLRGHLRDVSKVLRGDLRGNR